MVPAKPEMPISAWHFRKTRAFLFKKGKIVARLRPEPALELLE